MTTKDTDSILLTKTIIGRGEFLRLATERLRGCDWNDRFSNDMWAFVEGTHVTVDEAIKDFLTAIGWELRGINFPQNTISIPNPNYKKLKKTKRKP